MTALERIAKFAREDSLRFAATFVCAYASAYALLALPFALGFPWEGDAVDYRIPLLKWILRHGTYPNWPWTPIEDYPALGEFMMLPFLAVSGGLARIVPIAAYLLAAWYSAKIFLVLHGESFAAKREAATARLAAVAWVLGLRPLLIQANLLMTDNLATAFCLGAAYHAMRGRAFGAGLLLALAMASKYFAWGASVAAFLALAHALGWTKPGTAKKLALFCAVGALGALPFALRNFSVNGGNPFFPMFVNQFGQSDIGLTYNLESYGGGRSILALLRFPYDFLVTHNFVRNLYDYEVGKLFLVQLGCVLVAALWKRKAFAKLVRERASDRAVQAALLFSVAFFFAWFFTSQQMRFLLTSVILWNLLMLVCLWKLVPRAALAALILLGAWSVRSVLEPGRQLVARGGPTIFTPETERARECFARAGLIESDVVGYTGRIGVLGFFDHDFVFVKPNVYRVDLPGMQPPEPDFIYDRAELDFPGYAPWPAENPCIWKKIST